ncbi:DNA-3-methyladenine glycosylase [Cerasicoccus fimbriatus]|uniref:DNA-3-methyladenine glycosylase n=1 Tax=Cerasicoccus fimbriatus TaxID=3014554 RepID=UPI0022B48787|nr:DNA-3-methyladenine glycosylase [Cerasicoccus sp. TK19100]
MAQGRALTPDFFARDTVVVARELLGQYLCRRLPSGEILRWPLTEVEAYDGPEDKACHAHRGKTPRNAVMFGPPGRFYVYLCYGVHWMLNIVTGPEDFPAAVLIRGAGPMSGPGRLTKAMVISKELDAQLVAATSGLWVESADPVAESDIERTPRIGINYAPEPWLSAPYRFVKK